MWRSTIIQLYMFATQHTSSSCRSRRRQWTRTEKEDVMAKNFDEMEKVGKENVETATKSFDVFSKGVQAIVTEFADYSKKSFEENTKVFEQLLGAKSFDKAIEIQQGYFKNAFGDFVAQSTKISGLYADLAKETYKPIQSYIPKITQITT